VEAAVVAVEAVEAAEEDGEDEAMVDIEAVTPPPPELDECIERQLLDDVWLPPAGELCGSNIR